MEAPTGVENVQIILEAIDKQKGIECDYYSFDRATKKQQLLWHREKLEIVEPIHIREEMVKIGRDMTALYK
jgi:predicted DNA-binding transcriptional regulator YafY